MDIEEKPDILDILDQLVYAGRAIVFPIKYEDKDLRISFRLCEKMEIRMEYRYDGILFSFPFGQSRSGYHYDSVLNAVCEDAESKAKLIDNFMNQIEHHLPNELCDDTYIKLAFNKCSEKLTCVYGCMEHKEKENSIFREDIAAISKLFYDYIKEVGYRLEKLCEFYTKIGLERS